MASPLVKARSPRHQRLRNAGASRATALAEQNEHVGTLISLEATKRQSLDQEAMVGRRALEAEARAVESLRKPLVVRDAILTSIGASPPISPPEEQLWWLDDLFEEFKQRTTARRLQAVLLVELLPLSIDGRGGAAMMSSSGHSLRIAYKPGQVYALTLAMNAVLWGSCSMEVRREEPFRFGAVKTDPEERDWYSMGINVAKKLATSTGHSYESLCGALRTDLAYVTDVVPLRYMSRAQEAMKADRIEREGKRAPFVFLISVHASHAGPDIAEEVKALFTRCFVMEVTPEPAGMLHYTNENAGLDGILLAELGKAVHQCINGSSGVTLRRASGIYVLVRTNDASDPKRWTQTVHLALTNKAPLLDIPLHVFLPPASTRLHHVELLFRVCVVDTERAVYKQLKDASRSPHLSPHVRLVPSNTLESLFETDVCHV